MFLQYFDKYASLCTEAQKLQNDTKAHAPHYQLMIMCFKVNVDRYIFPRVLFLVN